MRRRRMACGWPGLVLGVLLGAVTPAPAQAPPSPERFGAVTVPSACVPLDALPAEARERVRAVTERPTLAMHGPVEAFVCSPPAYYWLLDHPDQTARLWRLLGVKAAFIRERGPQAFVWEDGEGSRIQWDAVLSTPAQHVWYAEGEVKPGPLLPTVKIQAVLVADHAELTEHGKTLMQHRVTLLLHTDSRSVALAARLLGASAPHLAEQYLGQVETFFGAMAWYLNHYPEHARLLTAQLQRPAATDPPLLPPPPPPAAKPAAGTE